MSTAKNQTLRIWQDVRGELGRISYQLYDCSVCRTPVDRVCTRTAGNYQFVDRCTGKATELQNRVIADGITLMLIVWSDSVSFPLKSETIRNLVKIITSVPVNRLISFLKEADSFLIAEVQKERICSFDDFKHHLNRSFPDLKGLIAPTQGLWRELRSSATRSLATRSLHTMFSFLTRLNVPDRRDLEADARDKFVEQEQGLSPSCTIREGGNLITLPTHYTWEEIKIMKHWFPNTIHTYESIYGSWKPCHGSGSVADSEEISLREKYAALGTDEDLCYLDLSTGGTGYCRSLSGFERCADVVFVPKSIDKLRTICKEPATLMFYQQGFLRTLVDYINSHEVLSKRISLDKAYLNTEMACRGSVDGSFATIDLSAASDSVSWDLVRSWFSHTPLWDALALTRSSSFRIKAKKANGEIVLAPHEGVTKKFAPMGSALCFPVECLVFAAMCEATIRASGENPHTSEYRVYGDDIIIETRFAEALIQRLEANGFKVNKDKSFYHVTPHNYRESCGGEYLDGEIVTPFRISRKFEGLEVGTSSDRLVALVDLCNRAFLWLPTLRSYVISELLTLPQRYQPFFTDDWATTLNERGKPVYEVSRRGGLVTFDASNYRLRKRKSRIPFAWEPCLYEHGAPKPQRGDIDYADEDIRYYEWLRSTHRRRSLSCDGSRIYLSHTPATRSSSSKQLATTWSKSLDADTHPSLRKVYVYTDRPLHLKRVKNAKFVKTDVDVVHKSSVMASYDIDNDPTLEKWLLQLDFDQATQVDGRQAGNGPSASNACEITSRGIELLRLIRAHAQFLRKGPSDKV